MISFKLSKNQVEFRLFFVVLSLVLFPLSGCETKDKEGPIITDEVLTLNTYEITADEIYPISDTENVFILNEKFGLIDNEGKILLEAKYYWIGINAYDHKLTVVNDEGQFLVDKKYKLTEEYFGYGYPNEDYYFIDIRDMKIYAADSELFLAEFQNGTILDGVFLNSVTVRNLDTSYDVVFNELFALGKITTNNGTNSVSLYSELIYSKVMTFSVNGLAAVQDNSGKWGFIDNKGNTIIPFAYQSILACSEKLNENLEMGFSSLGYAVVKSKNIWKVINSSGSEVLTVEDGDRIGMVFKNKLWLNHDSRWYFITFKQTTNPYEEAWVEAPVDSMKLWINVVGSPFHKIGKGYIYNSVPSDDTFALDLNLANDNDKGEPVFPVEDGEVIYRDPNWGFVLVEHTKALRLTDGTTANLWYSGYMHMTSIHDKGEVYKPHENVNILGYISNINRSIADKKYDPSMPYHLHFAIYILGKDGGLVSIDPKTIIDGNLNEVWTR